VVLLGRVALYGPAAARLHEEIIEVTAIWTEAGRGTKPLRPLGERGQETTLDQLEDALARSRRPSDAVVARALSFAQQDVIDLLPTLQQRSREAIEKAERQLAERGQQEASSLQELLERQRRRIEQAEANFDDRQRELFEAEEAERRQLRADRAHWLKRLERIDRELETDPPGSRRLPGSRNPARARRPRLSLAGHGVSAMAPDVQTINRDPELEWLDLIRPTGLVLSPTVIKDRGLIPERQTPADSAAFAACLSEEGPALPEPWRLFAEILGWDAGFIAGAPGGPALPDALAFAVPEHDTTLFPDWAIQGFGEDAPWQLLVRLEPAGVDPDGRGEADGWEASPHQRFERLLRETGVLVGVLISDQELRLIYAAKGETSGWLAFPLRSLATVADRPMLAGLKLVLGRFRLFNAPADQRLRALLKASRDAQAAVSSELSAQVLGALHELLRGLNAAEPALIQDLAENRPYHLYEGLLTVLLRLVFILYAEDRDLLPSATDGASRALYEQSYSVRGLYAKLAEDDALNPDTMDERLGGWGRLLALFRLIHKGHRSGFIRGRRGKLFDPDEFPFLEGRADADHPPRVIKLSDGCMLRILEGLMTLAEPRTKVRQRLSYRTLDVEQIGSVYETIMGFTVQTAPGRVLAIRAGRQNRTPVFADVERLVALKPAERAKYLKDVCKREGALPKAVATALAQAADTDSVAAVLDAIADERGSPRRVALGAGTPSSSRPKSADAPVPITPRAISPSRSSATPCGRSSNAWAPTRHPPRSWILRSAIRPWARAPSW
jgi:hypothetical protein